MSISEGDKIRLENIAALPGLMKLSAMLAQSVEDALAPVLEGGRVRSCLHILDAGAWRMVPGEQRNDPELRPLLCPSHPERLLCNSPAPIGGNDKSCLATHYAQEHPHEVEARCFVCEMPIVDELTGLRDDFEGITAEVTLHRNIPFLDDNRHRDFWWQFGGVLGVPPVAYLCPRHSQAAGKLPWNMGWPMGERIAS